VQGQHLNLYILEQIPVIGPAAFDEELGNGTVGAFIRDSVLRLSYTAEDLMPFARDLAHEGAPFGWDTEERRHLTARLDALFFYLYGFTREETDHVLDQFPIVRHKDEVEHGRYLTKELVLAYFNAVQAGDIRIRVTI
jgi:hypothetical protein